MLTRWEDDAAYQSSPRWNPLPLGLTTFRLDLCVACNDSDHLPLEAFKPTSFHHDLSKNATYMLFYTSTGWLDMRPDNQLTWSFTYSDHV